MLRYFFFQSNYFKVYFSFFFIFHLGLLVNLWLFAFLNFPGFCVCNEIEGEDFNVLIECLTDTFEDNKIEAYKLLKYLSSLDFMKQVCIYFLIFDGKSKRFFFRFFVMSKTFCLLKFDDFVLGYYTNFLE